MIVKDKIIFNLYYKKNIYIFFTIYIFLFFNIFFIYIYIFLLLFNLFKSHNFIYSIFKIINY